MPPYGPARESLDRDRGKEFSWPFQVSRFDFVGLVSRERFSVRTYWLSRPRLERHWKGLLRVFLSRRLLPGARLHRAHPGALIQRGDRAQPCRRFPDKQLGARLLRGAARV